MTNLGLPSFRTNLMRPVRRSPHQPAAVTKGTITADQLLNLRVRISRPLALHALVFLKVAMLELMLLDGKAQRVCNHLRENRDGASGDCIHRRSHGGGGGMIAERCVGPGTEIMFPCSTEEPVYQYKLGAHIARLFHAQNRPVYSIRSCQLKWPYVEP